MNHFFKKISIALLAISTSLPALAYDEQDVAAINEKLVEIQSSIEKKNFTPVVESMSPRLFTYLSDKVNISVDEAKEFVLIMTSSIMNGLDDDTTIDYQTELDKAEVFISTTGREYVVFPNTLVLMDDTNMYVSTGHLIAIEDDGEWYINRLGSQESIMMTKEIYPDITELTSPDDQVEIIPIDK